MLPAGWFMPNSLIPAASGHIAGMRLFLFIPPMPGPIAAAQALGVSEYLLPVIGMGVLCSIFPLIAGLIYAKLIGKKVKNADELINKNQVIKTYDQLKSGYGKLPGSLNTLAPKEELPWNGMKSEPDSLGFCSIRRMPL